MSKNQTTSQGARSAENVRLAGSVQGAQTLGEFDSVSVDASDDSAVSTALHPLRLLGMGFLWHGCAAFTFRLFFAVSLPCCEVWRLWVCAWAILACL